MALTVCTLAEGDLHVGVGVLLNSLMAAGYRGRLWVGNRGERPAWAAGATAAADGSWRWSVPGGAIDVMGVRLATPHHFTHHKPWWMQQVLAMDPGASGVVYADPDIVVKTDWDFVEDWVAGGLAVVTDILPEIGAGHPHRRAWAEMMAARGYPVRRWPERYVNGGWLGVTRERSPALAGWAELVEMMAERAGPLTDWRTGTRRKAFWSANQDGLNALLMTTDQPIAQLGPDAMDFAPGGWVLAHAIGEKPWHTDYLRAAWNGSRPEVAHVRWWDYADTPVPAVAPEVARRVRREVAVACMAVRFPLGLRFLPELAWRYLTTRGGRWRRGRGGA